MSTRIVTFLGLGRPAKPHYDLCIYEHDGIETPKTAMHDLATVMACESPLSMVVLGTSEVKERWFGDDQLFEALMVEGLGRKVDFPLHFWELKHGRTEDERWDIFEQMVQVLSSKPLNFESSAPEEIIVDITHGFRSQPFFASTSLAFIQSQQQRLGEAGPGLRILYAAFEKGKETAPVLDLSQFMRVLEWDAAIDSLMRHGRADDLSALLEQLNKKVLKQRKAQGKHRDFPKLKSLGQAAQRFADGLVTARVPVLLTSLAPALKNAIDQSLMEEVGDIPPLLRPQMKRLGTWANGMTASKCVSREGIAASLKLGELYCELQRYSEWSTLLRETLISMWALQHWTEDEIVQPGEQGNGFNAQREKIERAFSSQARATLGPKQDNESPDELGKAFMAMSRLRNDIQHGGFREDPAKGNRVRDQLKSNHDRIAKIFSEWCSTMD